MILVLLVATISCATLAATTIEQTLQTAPVFASNMVLQRDQENTIWGWANPGANVRIEFVGKNITTLANAKGEWRARLPKLEVLPSGTALNMEIFSEDEHLYYDNILVGDVWLCTGQSNMHWTLSQFKETERWTKESVNYSEVRISTVERKGSLVPTKQFKMEQPWSVCGPESSAIFSAVGYHFGKIINREVGIPIGLIATNLGAARIQTFMSEEDLASDPKILEYTKNIEALHQAKSSQEGRPLWDSPSEIYNQMIYPLVGFGIKGAIWYQGEGNIEEADAYPKMQQLMVKRWQSDWKMKEFPFFYVQIAPFNYDWNPAFDRNKAMYQLMQAQVDAQELIPNSQMVVISDIGEWHDIHPQNKDVVGGRLANSALHKVYGWEGSPLYPTVSNVKEVTIEGINALELSFTGARELKFYPIDPSNNGFSVAGEDKVYYPAKFRIVGTKIYLQAAEVQNPKYYHFAWKFTEQTRLFNEDQLPLGFSSNDENLKYKK